MIPFKRLILNFRKQWTVRDGKESRARVTVGSLPDYRRRLKL